MDVISVGELNTLLWECCCTEKAGKKMGAEIEELLPGFLKVLKAESTQLSIADDISIKDLAHLMHGFAMHSFNEGVKDKSDNDIANMILYSTLFGFMLGLYLGQEEKISIEGGMLQ